MKTLLLLPTAVAWTVDSAGRKWEQLRGGIALSAWNTKAQFKEVRVERNGEILFQDD